MTLVQSLVAFSATAAVLTVTPGVDTALVLRTAVTGGARRAAFAAAGIGLGCLVWGLAASIGLAAVLAASPIGFTALKWAGAAYLLYLGVNLVIRPRREWRAEATGQTARTGAGRATTTGFLTNVLNPKVGVFYISFLPQFIPDGYEVASFAFMLACLHVLLSVVWFVLLIGATRPLTGLLRRSAVISALDRITGAVFILFGLKLALSRLP